MRKPKQAFLPPDPKGELPYEVSRYLIALLVGVTMARQNAVEDLLKPYDLSVTQFRALTLINRLQPCSMTELAALTNTNRTTLTRVVDQLIEQTLVERSDGERDRRRVMLELTPSGAEKLTEAEKVVQDLGARALARVPEAMQRTIVEGLQLMLREFGDTRDAMVRVVQSRWPEDLEVLRGVRPDSNPPVRARGSAGT